VKAGLFAGCKPEVAAGPDGRILAVGARARSAAGRGAEVVRLSGTAWPGLIDSHIHLEGLADRHMTVDLTGARSLGDTLRRVERWAGGLAPDAWVLGAGWYNDAWPEPAFHTPRPRSGSRRKAGLPGRKDGHPRFLVGAGGSAGAAGRVPGRPRQRPGHVGQAGGDASRNRYGRDLEPHPRTR
jgi:hypothetical protein